MDEEVKNTEEKIPSIEQILQNIRGVISGKEQNNTDNIKDEEILELTEVVNDDGSISSLKQNDFENEKNNHEVDEDILDFIDNNLNAEEKISKSEDDNSLDSKSANLLDELQAKLNNTTKPSEDYQDEINPKIVKNSKSLISEEAANVSSEALKILVKTVSKPISDGLAFRSGTTVEDLAIELIKPYLSKWLDKNLPNIVKHLVEKEIQKLIPKDED